MTPTELTATLYEFIRPAYPDIQIRVEEDADGTRSLFFTEEKFGLLYPMQRYHYLSHRIPADFYEVHLAGTLWYELAPGESPDDLDYHDPGTIQEITPLILPILSEKTPFLERLNAQFVSSQAVCHGDFRHAKQILSNLNFTPEEQYDLFHVLMAEGGFCDCEILYNVFSDSEFAQLYWQKRNHALG